MKLAFCNAWHTGSTPKVLAIIIITVENLFQIHALVPHPFYKKATLLNI